VLYIPEQWSVEQKNYIDNRRCLHLAKYLSTGSGKRKLVVLIGELKELSQSRFAGKVAIKHLPDFHFNVPQDLENRLKKRFETELGLWNSDDESHLMVIATFTYDRSGATIEEASLVQLTSEWIPYESVFEKMLIDRLIAEHRPFVKGLRYNLATNKPLASAVLTNTKDRPTALFIVPAGATDGYGEVISDVTKNANMDAWIWNVEEGMPDLPHKRVAIAVPKHKEKEPQRARDVAPEKNPFDDWEIPGLA
jgi:hypothetical protein